MSDLPKLNFPIYRFRVSRSESSDGSEQVRIWDNLRQIWLLLTPEEWVRQHVIEFLSGRGVVPQMISQEHPVSIQGMNQRADVVVFGSDVKPLMLVECKAPSVELDSSVYAQALRYNNVVGARYIFLTNGLRHFIYERDPHGEYSVLDDFPVL